MTINLETEIIASRYDPVARDCFYTVRRGALQWTVKIPLAELNKHAGHKIKRRTHVATAIEIAMRGVPDKLEGV
jgi:hypothetical protein